MFSMFEYLSMFSRYDKQYFLNYEKDAEIYI